MRTTLLVIVLLAASVATSHAATPGAGAGAAPVLSIGIRDDRGVLAVCGGLRAPCVFQTIGQSELDVRVTGATVDPQLTFRIERTYRAPGTVRAKPLPSFRGAVDGSAGANGAHHEIAYSLDHRTLMGRRPGTTCFRAVLLATNSATRWRCVRYRPAVTIGWAGDITLGSSYGTAPGDGRSVFSAVHPLLRAPDLMIGNYEGTLSRGGRPRCSGGGLCYIFQGPTRMARGLAHAGFDVMNLANNHALDMGTDARRQTVRALSARRLVTAGLPGDVTVVQVADTRVAIVGFGFTLGTTLIRDLPAVRATVARAARAGDVVVVLHHGGEEGTRAQHVPHGDEGRRGDMRRFVRTVIDAGADVVLGSGPHVVRGIEQRRGRLAFYSTGNFAGWNNFARGGALSNSGVVDVTLQHDGTTDSAQWHGVRLTGPGIPVPDRSGSVVQLVRSLSRADFGTRAPRIRRDGTIALR